VSHRNDEGRAVRAGRILASTDELNRQDLVEERGGKFVVLAEPGGEIVGEHDTREAALDQVVAIEAAKERRNGSRVDARPVQRWDTLELRLDASTVVKHENGWIDVTGTATRSGVFLYMQADGSTRRELRPDGEVFDGASLATLRGVPFTNDHPVEPLDARNTRLHQVGTVLEVIPRLDAKLVDVRLRITDQPTIDEVAGGKVELSGGYTTDVLEEPGEIGSDVFDAVQTKIRYNHLALVDEARAGPVARLRLDGAHQMPKTTTIQIGTKTHQIKLDEIEGVPIQIGGAKLVLPAQMVAAIEAMVTGEAPTPAAMAEPTLEPELEVAAADVDPMLAAPELGEDPEEEMQTDADEEHPPKHDLKTDARLDALERKLVAMPAKIRQDSLRRGALERSAGPILGLAYRYDRADDLGLMRDTILAVDPELKARVDSNAADLSYLRGMFDLAVEQHAKRADTSADLGVALVGARQDGVETKVDAAQARYLARLNGVVTPQAEATN